MSEEKLKAAKLKKLELLERKRKRESELPHLYGFPWYEWAWSFFTTKNKMALLTASNQSGKSSTQIRKVIHLATAVEEWPQWWDHRPKQFWWLYPNKHVATVEFYQKWVPEFLPRGSMVTDPQYGWQAEFDQAKKISEIRFNTGVSIYFRSYETDVAALQSGTVDYIACFTGNTLVETPDGVREIKDFVAGDLVQTPAGPRKVLRCFNRRAPVIRRYFSNGEYIEATPDHKFLVNGEWVEFKDLTPDMNMERSKTWQAFTRKRLQYTKGKIIAGFLNIQIVECGISGEQLWSMGSISTNSYILKFGRMLMENCLVDTVFTILMRMWRITSLVIWNALVKVNIIQYTSASSGQMGLWARSMNIFASSAESLLLRVLHKKEYQNSAQKNVEVGPMQSQLYAKSVVESLCIVEFSRGIIVQDSVAYNRRNYILNGALIIGERDVYCLEVEEQHRFQVLDFIAKNCDEELDSALYSELQFRTVATNGYFSLVFTATKGQDFWRLAIEPKEGEKENFPFAWKRQVSMYDCMYYRDGKPGKFTPERIDEIKAACKSQAEIARRVYGKFVLSDNMAFPWFSEERHHKFVGKGEVPDTWDIYAASDLGSGNFSSTSHPAALVFVGVNPERTRGRVFRAWRGDDVNTTAGDVYEQYKQMCVTIGREPVSKSYDYESADFGIVVERAGDFWYRAEKNIIRGQELVNSLFKYDVLTLDEGDSEIDKMSAELQNVSKDGGKDQRDDLVSCLRYCIMKIPWDWEKIRAESKKDDRPKPAEPEKEPTEREIQREKMLQPPKAVDFGVEEEMEFWQEMFD